MATRVTEAKKQRAIAALVDLMQCDDFPNKGNGTCWEIERACDFIRSIPTTR